MKKENLQRISPFVIQETLSKSTSQKIDNIRKTRSGIFFITVNNIQQAADLLKITKLTNEVEVEVTNFTVKGVVKSWIGHELSEEELTKELSSQGVIGVRHLSKNVKHNKPVPIMLTFTLNQPPEHVYLCYEKCLVRPYYPFPMRCPNCHVYGHRLPCKSPKICEECAKTHRNGEDCGPAKCASCYGEDHNVRSPTCPRYIEEKSAIRDRVNRSKSFNEKRTSDGKNKIPPPENNISAYPKLPSNKETLKIPTRGSDLPSNKETSKIPKRESDLVEELAKQVAILTKTLNQAVTLIMSVIQKPTKKIKQKPKTKKAQNGDKKARIPKKKGRSITTGSRNHLANLIKFRQGLQRECGELVDALYAKDRKNHLISEIKKHNNQLDDHNYYDKEQISPNTNDKNDNPVERTRKAKTITPSSQ